MQVTAANFQEVVVQGSLQRPVVVDFWASWCAPCKVLAPILEKLAAELDFVLAKVDVEAEQQIAAYFRISNIPDIRMFVKGKMVDAIQGALPEAQLRERLAKFCMSETDAFLQQVESLVLEGQAAQVLPALEDFLQGEPENRKALYWKAKCLVDLGRGDEAQGVLDRFSESDDFYRQATSLRELMLFHGECARTDLSGPLAEGYRAACAAAVQGEYAQALEQFLELVQSDRAWNAEAPRKGMITLFGVLGAKHALTWEYRSKLNRVLFI